MDQTIKIQKSTKALQPVGPGYNFVCYADCCSGIPGTSHAENFRSVNNIVAGLSPQPDFICFPGDQIRGLSTDENELLNQWNYFMNKEMGWLKGKNIPVYHTTGNHSAYDLLSEQVFRRIMEHHPDNGPQQQKKLSYYIRKPDLLMVFINTMWSGIGGEGRTEIEWLSRILRENSNTPVKLVFGHHPVFPVNGFSGVFQREIETANGREFWNLLSRNNVLAYFCSHILAFDAQVHSGVLQIVSGGAGTQPLMPPDTEYHHCVQAALDHSGLRYQVLDTNGMIREWLSWPLQTVSPGHWNVLEKGNEILYNPGNSGTNRETLELLYLRFSLTLGRQHKGSPQVLLCSKAGSKNLPRLWIGFRGKENRFTILMSKAAGKSPHLWNGPCFKPGSSTAFTICIHPGMGPGGFHFRRDNDTGWSSLPAASPWGAEVLGSDISLSSGYSNGEMFRGEKLKISYAFQQSGLTWHDIPEDERSGDQENRFS